MKREKVVSKAMMVKACIERAEHNIFWGNAYSWRRWSHYNKLRLARAHKYYQRACEQLEGSRVFTNRMAAAMFGAGTVVDNEHSIPPEEYSYLDGLLRISLSGAGGAFTKHKPFSEVPF